MTVEVRPFDSLGRFEIDWLKARHHFSFGDDHDPERMGVGPLRVWSDDRVAPGKGFEPHPHRDMEIITYVRRGAVVVRGEGTIAIDALDDAEILLADLP
jgi:quercetin 2,3-dioxygenase